MLSSVAERVYWLGRYVERVENSARLMDVYSSMLFDLPRDSNIGWGILLDITGSNETYNEKYNAVTETNVVRYLLADQDNPSSIISCLKMLRENGRTTREIIPSEAWEQINALYLQSKESIASGVGRKSRRELFHVMIADCQRLAGMLSGSMAHNTAYTFIQLGRMLERADMTTRIVDVGSFSLLPAFAKFRKKSNFLEPFENVIWMNILRSLSGYQAYRQNVANRVGGEGVVRFMLQDNEFPKAVNYCLDAVSSNLEQLPNHDDVQMAVDRVKRITSEANVFHLLENGLLEFIDELQISIADVHDELSRTWFGVEGNEEAQQSSQSLAETDTPVLPLGNSQRTSRTTPGNSKGSSKGKAKGALKGAKASKVSPKKKAAKKAVKPSGKKAPAKKSVASSPARAKSKAKAKVAAKSKAKARPKLKK